MVVAEGVLRSERRAVDERRLADERVDLRRMDEGVDGALEPLRREVLGLSAARAEPGSPEQALGLLWSERSPIHRYAGRRDACHGSACRHGRAIGAKAARGDARFE